MAGARMSWGQAAALAGLVVLAYSNSISAGFVSDSRFVILGDPRLRDVSRANLELIFTQNYWWPRVEAGLYRPVVTLSYLFNYAVLGDGSSPQGYHWINLLFHVANTLLVCSLALRLFGKPRPAFFTAAIFAVHPVNTESVTNIVGRADLMAGTAVLGGLLLYDRSTRETGRSWLWWLVGLALAALLGVFSKENAVVIVGAILLWDLAVRWQSQAPQRRWDVLGGYLACAPALLALWGVRHLVFAKLRAPEIPFLDNPLFQGDFFSSRLTAIKVIGKYLWLLIWPRTLSCDYSYNQISLSAWPPTRWGDWQAWLALAIILSLTGWVILQRRVDRAVFFFGLLFFVALAPTANLVLLIGSIMAERFLYLPSVGFAGCLVAGVWALAGSRRATLWVLGLTTLALGMRTFLRNPDWADQETVWMRAVQACPNSFKTHNSLASAWSERGPKTDIDAVIREAEIALSIIEKLPVEQQHTSVYAPLGSYYMVKGDRVALAGGDGAPWYRKAVEVLERGVPVDRALNGQLRRMDRARGRPPELIVDLGNSDLYDNLGLACLKLGESHKALEAYTWLRRLNPKSVQAYLKVAGGYMAEGRREDTVVTLLEALTLGPNAVATSQLLELYPQIAPGSCAIRTQARQGAINFDCPLVRRHLCQAYRGLSDLYRDTNRLADADQAQAMFQRYCEIR